MRKWFGVPDMGQVVAAVAYFLVVNVGIPVAVLDFAIVVGVNALLSAVSSKLFGPKAPKGNAAGLQVMKRSGLEYRKVVYGQAAVSGPIYYNNTSGDDNKYLWYGIALCEGASEDIVRVYLEKDDIPKASIDWTAGTGASDGTGTGGVSTALWVGENSTKAVNIYYYLGDDSQPAPGALDSAFGQITTNHRLRGVTHIVLRLLYDDDTTAIWKSGPPKNVRVVLKGRKLYDPRLDSNRIIDASSSPVTYGSGAHRLATASTWAYSNNPALCVADYLTQIMGVAETSIDWASIADAADDCDVSVAIPTASTEKRFTCNGALSLGDSHKNNLDSLLSAMDGRLSYSGGVWRVRASVWETSSVSITADDLAGYVQVRGSAP